jgi:hypothetical protein
MEIESVTLGLGLKVGLEACARAFATMPVCGGDNFSSTSRSSVDDSSVRK